jgi:hypothetical protein
MGEVTYTVARRRVLLQAPWFGLRLSIAALARSIRDIDASRLESSPRA